VIDKFGVMGLTRQREQNPGSRSCTRPLTRKPIYLQGTKIPLVSSHKFLGVILDQELQWKEHVDYALHVGTKWVEQYQQLATPLRGVSAKHMQKFYLAITVLNMLYVADLFLIPENRNLKGTKYFIGKLGKVQRQASLHITRMMWSAPMDTIDACTDLLHFHLLIEKLTH